MSPSSQNHFKDKKLRTAALSIAVSFALIIVKIVVGILTNSISILASAVDSFLDIITSSVNYVSIQKSEKPADSEHKFGHGKAEGLAGLFQTFVIWSSAVYLVYLSIVRLTEGGQARIRRLGDRRHIPFGLRELLPREVYKKGGERN